MHKRTVRRLWNKFKDSSVWLFALIFITSAIIAIFALRQNNLQMIKLREAVYVADKENGDVEAALRELREHVYGHMNTNLRANSDSSELPIQLVNKFNAIVAAEQARIAALGGNNAIYVKAQKECENPNVVLAVRAQCIQNYVTANGGQQGIQLPAKELYTFDFASPKWSPDIAGWALVVAVISGLLLIIRIIIGLVIKNYIK
jgi:hypothetical protein